MKIALAFNARRQEEWQAAFERLRLDRVAPVEIVGTSTLPALRAAQPHIVVSYSRDFSLPFLREPGPNLRWVHFMNAGIDEVAQVIGDRVPFQVSNVRGIHADAMGEYVLMALLHFAKRVPEWTRLQQQHKWQVAVPAMLRGKHVLVAGAGSIGSGVARVCKSLGMQVTGLATQAGGRPSFDRVVTSMADVLADVDYVVSSLPLTEQTRGIFDTAAFAEMKPGTVFVNIGRGEVVDDAALIAALQSGHLGGAALDALSAEPLPEYSQLWDAPNILITPHVSGRFEGGVERGAEVFAENFRRFVAGEPLATPVDLARGY